MKYSRSSNQEDSPPDESDQGSAPHPELGALALYLHNDQIFRDYDHLKRKYLVNTRAYNFAEDIEHTSMYLNKGIKYLHMCYTNPTVFYDIYSDPLTTTRIRYSPEAHTDIQDGMIPVKSRLVAVVGTVVVETKYAVITFSILICIPHVRYINYKECQGLHLCLQTVFDMSLL
jgi:hypothetical protein